MGVQVIVRDVISNKKAYFHVNEWLSSDRGSMSTHMHVAASSEAQPKVAACMQCGRH